MGARLATLGNNGGASVKGHVGFDTLGAMAAMGARDPIAAMRGNSPFLRVNSPFPRDSQEVIDNEVLQVGREKLVMVSDLLDANLTRALPNWLSLTTYTSQRSSEAGRAQMGMTPNTRGERQVNDIEEYSTPIFCVWDDFEFSARDLATAARVGFPIDTSMAAQATRNVNELLEWITVIGTKPDDSPINFYGLPVYGLLNAPNRNPFIYAGGVPWDNGAKTGSEILLDLTNMIKMGEDALYDGPWTLYLPKAWRYKLGLEYTANYPRTIMERLLQVAGLESIKFVPALPDNTSILLQRKSNVFDFLVGMLPTSFSWATNPQMPFSGVSSMVAAVLIPRPKYDYNDKTGIVVGFTS